MLGMQDAKERPVGMPGQPILPTLVLVHPNLMALLLLQDAEKRPVESPGQPMLMLSYQHMAQLVEQKRLEWEAATHNAAIAGITNARPADEVYADEDDE